MKSNGLVCRLQKKGFDFLKKAVLCCFFAMVFVSCNNTSYIKRMQELEEGVSRPTSEAELKEAIRKYEKRVSDIMVAENRIGIWYKILGSRYMDQKMYKKALDCFKAALEYYPENKNLFYQAGLAASLVAKNSLDFDLTGSDEQQQRCYEFAVSAYRRAIDIDPKYSKAIYAVSVLYIFELGKPAEAVPLLEGLIAREKKPIQQMFLLARAYYLTGNKDGAVSLYKKIIESTSSAERKAEAEENMRFIQEESGTN